ncbi:MAG: 30S ribosomal protein S15 [bacterium]|nr:30S ribosomal protein S15 [bacterium]
MLTKQRKLKIIKTVAIHDKDTGSPEVQIAVLTKRIDELSKHLKEHKKDTHSRRGLLSMVADRQSHLRYLQKKNTRRYNAVVKKLELKK